jgi:hypothetical protein
MGSKAEEHPQKEDAQDIIKTNAAYGRAWEGFHLYVPPAAHRPRAIKRGPSKI